MVSSPLSLTHRGRNDHNLPVNVVKKGWKYIIIYILAVIGSVFAVFPFYWMIKTAFTPNNLMYQINPSILPIKLTLEHFQQLLIKTSFMTFFINSIYVSCITTVITMVISILGSYALSRLKFRLRGFFHRSIILSYLLPSAVLFIPMYILVSGMGLANNKNALLLIYPTFTVPYACYMLVSYFKSIPYSLEEAALIDGCNRLQTLRKIVIPIAAPGIAVVATFAFTLSWSEFIYALVATTSPDQQTVTSGISSFQYADTYIWGLIMSASVLASIPPLLLYLLTQKFMIGGLTAGGVKDM